VIPNDHSHILPPRLDLCQECSRQPISTTVVAPPTAATAANSSHGIVNLILHQGLRLGDNKQYRMRTDCPEMTRRIRLLCARPLSCSRPRIVPGVRHDTALLEGDAGGDKSAHGWNRVRDPGGTPTWESGTAVWAIWRSHAHTLSMHMRSAAASFHLMTQSWLKVATILPNFYASRDIANRLKDCISKSWRFGRLGQLDPGSAEEGCAL
jgi:hypothetical protein